MDDLFSFLGGRQLFDCLLACRVYVEVCIQTYCLLVQWFLIFLISLRGSEIPGSQTSKSPWIWDLFCTIILQQCKLQILQNIYTSHNLLSLILFSKNHLLTPHFYNYICSLSLLTQGNHFSSKQAVFCSWKKQAGNFAFLFLTTWTTVK